MNPAQFYDFVRKRCNRMNNQFQFSQYFPNNMVWFTAGPLNGFVEPVRQTQGGYVNSLFQAYVRLGDGITIGVIVDRDNAIGGQWVQGWQTVHCKKVPCDPPTKEQLTKLRLYAPQATR
jgi:hypothetical protein